MARLCCSIEMEPRTLNQGQLNHAREAAVDLVQKMEYNEASNVFIEGLRPVVSIKEMEQMVDQGRQQQQPHKLADATMELDMERAYRCACTVASTNEDESPIDQKSDIREPLSAPF